MASDAVGKKHLSINIKCNSETKEIILIKYEPFEKLPKIDQPFMISMQFRAYFFIF